MWPGMIYTSSNWWIYHCHSFYKIFLLNISYKYQDSLSFLPRPPFHANTTIIISSSSYSSLPTWPSASSSWLMALLASKYLVPFMKINHHLPFYQTPLSIWWSSIKWSFPTATTSTWSWMAHRECLFPNKPSTQFP